MTQLRSQLVIGSGITTAQTPKHLHKTLILKVVHLKAVLLYGPISNKMPFFFAQMKSSSYSYFCYDNLQMIASTAKNLQHSKWSQPAQPRTMKSFPPGSSWRWLSESFSLGTLLALIERAYILKMLLDA